MRFCPVVAAVVLALDPSLDAWRGAAALARAERGVTRAQYEEHGSSVLHAAPALVQRFC